MECASPVDMTDQTINRKDTVESREMMHKQDAPPPLKTEEGEERRPHNGNSELQSPHTIRALYSAELIKHEQEVYRRSSDNDSTPPQDAAAAIAPLPFVLSHDPMSPTMRDTDEFVSELPTNESRELDAAPAVSPGGNSLMTIKSEDAGQEVVTLQPCPPSSRTQSQVEQLLQQHHISGDVDALAATSMQDLSSAAVAFSEAALALADSEDSDDEGHTHSLGSSLKQEGDDDSSSVPTPLDDASGVLTPIQQQHAKQKQKKEKGVSCHQCKTTKDGSVLLFCVNKADKGKRKRSCRKKYCDACLRRAYNMTIENFSQEEIDRWQCPACQSKCVCAACSRKHDLAVQAQQKMAAAAMHHAATAASYGYGGIRPNMALMQFAASMNKMSPEQRLALLRSTASGAAPSMASTTSGVPVAATAVTPVPAILPPAGTRPTTPTPATTLPSLQADGRLQPVTPVQGQTPAAAAVLIPSQSMNRSSSTVTAVAVSSQPVLANVAAGMDEPIRDTSVHHRARPYSCPTSPVRHPASAFSYPATMPQPSKQPPRLPLSSTVQAPHRDLQSTAAGGTMPQRRRRHSLKPTPLSSSKKAQYHGTIAHVQMLQQQQQQDEANSRTNYPSHLNHDAHSEFTLPASFSQSMSLTGNESPHDLDSIHLRSAPVSPARRNQLSRAAALAAAASAAAIAVRCSEPAMAAIDLSTQSISTSESPPLSPTDQDDDTQMMTSLSPLHQANNSRLPKLPAAQNHPGQPRSDHHHHSHHQHHYQQQQPSFAQQHEEVSPRHRQYHYQQQNSQQHHHPSHPLQQHLSGFAPFQPPSPQASPQTLQYQQSMLSSYLQQQQQQQQPRQHQQHSIYNTAPSDMQNDLPQTSSSLMESLNQLGHSHGGSAGFDPVLSSDAHPLNGLQASGPDGETLSLHLDLEDPTATLNTINQLQVTLQSVINSKTAQAQAQQHLNHLARRQYQHQQLQLMQQEQQQQQQQHQQQLIDYNASQDPSSLDLPFSSTDGPPSELEVFPGASADQFVSDVFGSTLVPGPGASPTFAFTSSRPMFGSSPAHAHKLSHTPNFLHTSPTNNSPRSVNFGSAHSSSHAHSHSAGSAATSGFNESPSSLATSGFSNSSHNFSMSFRAPTPTAQDQLHRSSLLFHAHTTAMAQGERNEQDSRPIASSPTDDGGTHAESGLMGQSAQEFVSATLS